MTVAAAPRAKFRSMTEGTAQDWQIIIEGEMNNMKGLPDRILAEVEKLKEGIQPFPVSRYEHSLQTASRAHNAGADEEMVVAALVHDIGDALALLNHGEYAAAILKPFVSEKVHWIVQHHDEFQGVYFWEHLGKDPNTRDKYRDNPWFDDCVAFCADWDQAAFDPDYDTHSIEFFEPMVRRVFSSLKPI